MIASGFPPPPAARTPPPLSADERPAWSVPLLATLALHALLACAGFLPGPAKRPLLHTLAAGGGGGGTGVIEIEWLPPPSHAPAAEPAPRSAVEASPVVPPAPPPEAAPVVPPEPVPPSPSVAPDFVVPVAPAIVTPSAPPPQAETAPVAPPVRDWPVALRRPKSPATGNPDVASSAIPPPAAAARGSGTASSVASGGDDAEGAVVIDNKRFTRPPYPYEARLNRYTGTVLLAIRVVDGRITGIEIRRSSGHALLDQTASAWVRRRWKFPPGVTRLVVQPFEFSLSESR